MWFNGQPAFAPNPAAIMPQGGNGHRRLEGRRQRPRARRAAEAVGRDVPEGRQVRAALRAAAGRAPDRQRQEERAARRRRTTPPASKRQLARQREARQPAPEVQGPEGQRRPRRQRRQGRRHDRVLPRQEDGQGRRHRQVHDVAALDRDAQRRVRPQGLPRRARQAVLRPGLRAVRDLPLRGSGHADLLRRRQPRQRLRQHGRARRQPGHGVPEVGARSRSPRPARTRTTAPCTATTWPARSSSSRRCAGSCSSSPPSRSSRRRPRPRPGRSPRSTSGRATTPRRS